MGKTEDFWKLGQKAAIARLTGIGKSDFSRILHRKAGASKVMAMRLEAAAKSIGVEVEFMDWLFSRSTKHPAFYGAPDKNEIRSIKKAKILNK